MARGLVISLPFEGHMVPLLPLVRELSAQGDEMVVYTTPRFAARVEDCGARWRPHQPGRLDDLSQLPDRTEEISSLLMAIVGDVLDADLPGMRAERPDYVVSDSVAPWGQWIGQLLGVPIVTSVTTFAVNRHVLAFAASHGVRPKSARLALSKLRHVSKALALRRRLVNRHGVRGPGVFRTVFGRSELNLVHTSREFQPCGETFDETFQFVGPPDGAAVTSGPGAAFQAPSGTAPIVYVSLGTLFNRDVSFYRRCFDAFRDEPLQVVMSIGSQVAAGDLGAVPANVSVAGFVPQIDVLRRTSVFVTHGGMNSVSESLRLQVPMVTVPQMGEQELVSRRVEQLGAGIYLSKAAATSAALRASVREALTDPGFRANAGRIGETLVAAGGTSRAAGLVKTFVRAHAARSD